MMVDGFMSFFSFMAACKISRPFNFSGVKFFNFIYNFPLKKSVSIPFEKKCLRSFAHFVNFEEKEHHTTKKYVGPVIYKIVVGYMRHSLL